MKVNRLLKLNRLLAILVFFLILGCAKDSCVEPFVRIGDMCCHDANNNGICDIEEVADQEPGINGSVSYPETGLENKSDTASSEEKKVPGSAHLPEDTVLDGSEPEPDPEPEPGIIEPEPQVLSPSREDAEKTVNLFAQSWQSKQYNMVYSLLTKKLKDLKSADEFRAIMELNPSHQRIEEVEVKDIDFVSEEEAEVTLEFWTTVKSYETEDTELIFEDSEWRIEGMPDVFYVDTYGAACGGFTKDFNKEECAKDLAIKVDDPGYCVRSGCHYSECIIGTKGSMSKQERVTACNMCPPVSTTTKQCILDVALELDDISVCNEIPESSYSDRYCMCYGGFAKAKGSSGYCSMITDPDYKDLCIKGFEGGYC